MLQKSTPVHVTIDSFQSIDRLEIEISGFTCITGPTNIGKSSIIRALSGALLGSPVVGDVRRGRKFCTVEMKSGDWSLKWEKGERGINRYWIPVDAEKPLDKVGQGQIEQVTELGFGSVKVGDSTVQPWLATQFEPIFLMNKSGPAVTDFLSEVSRLKVLQDAITINVRGKKRSLDKAKMRDEDAAKLRERESRLSRVDDMVQLRADLKAQMESIEEYGDRMSRARGFLDTIGSEASVVESLQGVKGLKVPADAVGKALTSVREAVRSYAVLESEASRIIELKAVGSVSVPDEGGLGSDVEGLSAAHDLASRLLAEQAAVNVLSTTFDVPDVPDVPDGLARMEELAKSMKSIREDEARLAADLKSVEAELVEIQAEIDLIPVCPTCDRPLSDSAAICP